MKKIDKVSLKTRDLLHRIIQDYRITNDFDFFSTRINKLIDQLKKNHSFQSFLDILYVEFGQIDKGLILPPFLTEHTLCAGIFIHMGEIDEAIATVFSGITTFLEYEEKLLLDKQNFTKDSIDKAIEHYIVTNHRFYCLMITLGYLFLLTNSIWKKSKNYAADNKAMQFGHKHQLDKHQISSDRNNKNLDILCAYGMMHFTYGDNCYRAAGDNRISLKMILTIFLNGDA